MTITRRHLANTTQARPPPIHIAGRFAWCILRVFSVMVGVLKNHLEGWCNREARQPLSVHIPTMEIVKKIIIKEIINMKKNTKNTRKNSNYQNKLKSGIVELTRKVGKEGFKKAVAYIPGCLGKGHLDLVVKYVLTRAFEEGYIICNIFFWEDVDAVSKSYTEKEADDLLILANHVLADKYAEHQFEAVFSFHADFDISIEGYHNTNLPKNLWLGCLTPPSNKKDIYKPNSDELKPGIIPGYWLGRDEDFDKWVEDYYSKAR